MATDYGVIISPHGPDLPEMLKAASCIPSKAIQKLHGIAYLIVGEPGKVQFADHVVGIIEVRNGAVMGMIRQLKPSRLAGQFKPYLLPKIEWSDFLSDPLHK